MLFLSLQFSKSRERNDKVELFQENRDGVGVGAGEEHPQDQTRGEPLFLINYINIFNSSGQFPSYLINSRSVNDFFLIYRFQDIIN